MTSATRIDHAHCVRVRAPSALRRAGLRQRRPLQVIVGRTQAHRGLHRSMTVVRLTVGNGGARVLNTISVVLVHHCRHNRTPIVSIVAHQTTR